MNKTQKDIEAIYDEARASEHPDLAGLIVEIADILLGLEIRLSAVEVKANKTANERLFVPNQNPK